ncbi:MAG: HEAT repeat domain-containing protein [Phycisphaeraceae bacterium]
MQSILATSAFWSLTLLAFAAGFVLLVSIPFKRKHWAWKLLIAMGLIFGPYIADVIPSRVKSGESMISAAIPTTLLLQLMSPDTEWPYGTVFDRLNKAQPRHAMWDWQLDSIAAWCEACLATDAMAIRGVQIAGTVASRGSDAAVGALGKALSHKNPEVRVLACDILLSMKDRAALVREVIERVMNDTDERVRNKTKQLLNAMR